jgi:predicted RNA binding protein with dsRBD fold (UPF0201 family)|tara:strand:+ start:871 stop:1203 length:333 start_codon:yes stop_codon:yes gene_type:complete
MDTKEYIDLTINTTTNEDLNTIIDAIYEIIPMKTIKFVELPTNNYVYMYINNNNYVDNLVDLLDNQLIMYSKMRYLLKLYTKNAEFPKRIHINKKGHKVETKKAIKTLTI